MLMTLKPCNCERAKMSISPDKLSDFKRRVVTIPLTQTSPTHLMVLSQGLVPGFQESREMGLFKDCLILSKASVSFMADLVMIGIIINKIHNEKGGQS
ncbi:hypothetical protein Hdeb2414_s0016g00469431 [Helianthus debilis subsp. tardiflorus]